MPTTPPPLSFSLKRLGLTFPMLAVVAGIVGCGESEHGVRRIDTSRLDQAGLRTVAGSLPTHRVSVTVRQGAHDFREKAVVAAAGRTSFTLRNPTGADHNIAILDASKPLPDGPPGFLGLTPVLPSTSSFRYATGTTVLDLKPGKYRLVCLVQGHAVNGMSIPLEVVDDPQATDRPLPNSAEEIARELPANSVTLTRPGPTPAFDKKEATVRAGRIGFRFVNKSPVPSDVAVLGADGSLYTPDSPVMGPGVAGFVLNLPRGEYSMTNLPDAANMTIPLHVR